MAIVEYGGVDALAALDRREPEACRRDFLQNGVMWVCAIGALDPARFRPAVERFLSELPERAPEEIPLPVQVDPRAPRREVERVELQQSKLVLLFRMPWATDVDTWIGRRLFASMLGGGPHSRLFRVLREERSLAYYAHAGLDRHKGLGFVQIGLDEPSAEPAEDEILRQVADLLDGGFSDEELETARAGLVSQVQAVDDSPFARCEFTSEQWLMEADRSPDQLAELYARTSSPMDFREKRCGSSAILSSKSMLQPGMVKSNDPCRRNRPVNFDS